MNPEPQKDYLTDLPYGENFGYTLASPWRRLGATILESIIIYIPLAFIQGEYSFPFGNDTFFSSDVFNIQSQFFEIGIAAVLGAFFYSMWSCNLGHKLLGMKVISAVDGSDQRKASTGAIREVLKNVLGNFIIPSIWLLWDDRKQNLYDKITKTLVVYNRDRV